MKILNFIKNNTYVILLTITYLSASTISIIHIIDMFYITNTYLNSIIIAITIELGAILALYTLFKKYNLTFTYFIFFILFLYQIIGNYTYHYLHFKDEYLNTIINAFYLNLFFYNNTNIAKILIAFITAIILPIISLSFVKIYINNINNQPSPVSLSTENTENNLSPTPKNELPETKNNNKTKTQLENPCNGTL